MNSTQQLRHDMRLALCCVPAILIIFGIGLATQHLREASVMASGALPLAFGASKTWEGSSAKLLLATLLSLGLCAFFGALTGSLLLFISGSMLFAAGYAVISGINGTAGWVVQQSAIAWMISGYFPGDISHAASRAGLVMLGGTVQLMLICLLVRSGDFRLQSLTRFTWRSAVRRLKHASRPKIHLRWSVVFAVIAMGTALLTVHHFSLQNGYWTGMTLLLCLRSHFRESLLRVPARTLGTLSGCLAAGILSHNVHQPALLAAAFILSAYIAFTLSYRLANGSYFVFTFFVTLMVVLMISLTGLVQGNVAEDRLLATAIGSGFALAAILLTRLAAAMQAKLSGKADFETLY
ncbi:MAG: FUSC family protein [Pantoea sp.]|uniref:FUSC family protein n=1 Tax=Pantoea TaxID=53335 RepID=UPI0024470A2A|nr:MULTISPECIES: FUSC family protein [Pantoea]MBS6035627.1 FUSC family protein [Pantoea sp.]MDH2125386.1 FUSC family protein [Pantoea brenneri]MDU4128280.1 FUSC family protein [Pantoea sp.]